MKKITMLLWVAVAVASCNKDIKSAVSSSSYSTRSDITVTPSYIVLSNYAYTWDSSAILKKHVMMIPVNLSSINGSSDKISVVIVDKNGKVFDPAKGEVFSRDEGLKTSEDKLNPTDISAGKFSYDYSGKASWYGDLNDYHINDIKSKNRLYYRIPGSMTQEGKDIYIGFSIYLPKRSAYQVVLVAPVAHV